MCRQEEPRGSRPWLPRAHLLSGCRVQSGPCPGGPGCWVHFSVQHLREPQPQEWRLRAPHVGRALRHRCSEAVTRVVQTPARLTLPVGGCHGFCVSGRVAYPGRPVAWMVRGAAAGGGHFPIIVLSSTSVDNVVPTTACPVRGASSAFNESVT